MTDPGLPPKPRSLHLLESLVNEEEARDRGSPGGNIYIPLTGTQSPSDPEYWEPERQAVPAHHSGSRSSANNTHSDNIDLEMKEANKRTKMAQDKPSAGPRGKKLRKPRSRSNSSERFVQGGKSKKSQRPFSADYNKSKREQISSKVTNGRAKSAKGGRGQQKAKGRRPRSPASYSSATYSSDEDYPKKEAYRKGSETSGGDKKKEPAHDAFFDSDKEPEISNDSYSSDSSRSSTSASSYSSSFDSASDDDRHSNKRSSVQEKEPEKKYSRRSSSSSSSSSDTDIVDRKKIDKEQLSRVVTKKKYSKRSSSSSSSDSETDKKKHKSSSKYVDPRTRAAKTVYVDKHGHQHSRKRIDSDNSDLQRMVVVDDYSTMSEDEKAEKRPERVQQPARLLSRKKKKRVTVVQQIQPDLYIEGKLQQKYSELEELMACSFVDPRSQVTRHHLYQMELLRDQYRTVSHGRPSSAVIIPRSLPGAVRNRGGGQRPGSARPPPQQHFYTEDGEHQSYENAYGTIRSVMGAERARKHNKIRTDIHADRPSSATKSSKKKKKLEAKLKHALTDSEEDISEKPSMTSKGSSRSDGSTMTPRSGGPAIDHHIKYTENEKLKKWLKEKDKLYRKQVKQEKRKKKADREKLINEANDKLEKKIESQKRVKVWMKEKNHELYLQQKAEKKRQKQEQGQNKETTAPVESTKNKRQLREDDVQVEEDKCKGEETPDYVKQQIRDKREIQEENRQAKLAEKGGPHPPQTKFIYKRPVAGKIKLNMQARGKSPTPKASDATSETEEEKSEKMRISYDDWVKKKRDDDVVKRKNAAKQKQSEMAKSDPELNRMIPEVAKRRIEDKLNMRKKVNTGIKSIDEPVNKSFGGGEFDGEEIQRNAYRLEGDTRQTKRPSTAPVSRGRMPQPKQSSSSPRKAIIPQRPDKSTSTPHTLPFPPEKGIPAHVASRQQKIFDGKVASNLSESEQKELLQEVLVQEGVANIDEAGAEASDHQQPRDEQDTENMDSSKHADIETLMYSPKKKDSSDSSDSEADKPGVEDDKDMRNTEDSPSNTDDSSAGLDQSPTHIDSFGTMEDENSQNGQDSKSDAQSSNQYRTYSNLNDLQLDSSNQDAHGGGGMDLGVDMEKLRQRVEALSAESTGPPLIFSSDPRDSYESRSTDDDESHSESVDRKVITIISGDTDPNIIGILKESRKIDDFPIPEPSDELPEHRAYTEEANDSTHLNADESLSASRKRVSFNEQPEVFQSIDSSSTDTVTPEQDDDFDPDAESLDAQPYYVDEPESGDRDNNTPGDNEGGGHVGNDVEGVESDKLYFNIGGIELKPTVIAPDDVESEPQSTFITNPDTEA